MKIVYSFFIALAVAVALEIFNDTHTIPQFSIGFLSACSGFLFYILKKENDN